MEKRRNRWSSRLERYRVCRGVGWLGRTTAGSLAYWHSPGISSSVFSVSSMVAALN
uniref:Uncharacterized protein n=1 Tax=Arundo donax TaxID=35708 RepID=A0A0A9DZI2_ARUDO